jgi:hypothetical protein
MTSSELLPATVLNRKAVVYVRQSTQSQVMTNLESKRRQYDLVEVARQRGFVDVEIIDDDRLVAWLCGLALLGLGGDWSRCRPYSPFKLPSRTIGHWHSSRLRYVPR